jgi:arabinofuranosyltransferase
MVVSSNIRRVLAVVVLALSGIVLWVHARSYLPFMIDDAFISLRYSWRVLHGQGLTWTDGERVEGYSNLLWVLLVAAGGLVQSNLVWVARVLTFAATTGGFGLLLVSGLRRAGFAALFFSGVAALALALCGPVAAWSIGGMEQPLLVAFVLAAVVASESLLAAETNPLPAAVLSMSLPLGLLCLLRPDGAIFTLAAVLALLCGRGPRMATFRLVFWLALPPVICTLGQLAFRMFYYGDFWPNTYYAKGPFSWARVEQGWQYIHRSLKPMGPLWVGGTLTLCLAAFSRELRRRIWFALFALILWLLYLVRIGGDIFPQRRHLLVVFALLAFLLLALLQWLWERRHLLRFSAWLVGPVLLTWLGVAQQRDIARLLALSDKGHWSGQPVGQFLRKVFEKQRPLLAVDAAGALPYFYQLPCLDMLGLNDRHIARHPPPDIGTGFIGHELGDGRYVLSRKPDLVAFWTPVGGDRPRYRSGLEMVEQPTFYELYQAITFETDDASHRRTRLWLRRRDGRLGVQTHGDQIDVPGYLLQGGDDVVRLDPRGRLYVSLKPNDLAAVRRLRLPPGRFAVQVAADGPTTVQVLDGGRTLVLDDQGAFTLEAGDAEPGGVDIRLTATAATHVFGLVFTRQRPVRWQSAIAPVQAASQK